MDTLDSPEQRPKSKHDNKLMLASMGVNLGALLVIGMLIRLAYLGGNSGEIEGGLVLYAFWILAHAALSLIVGIILIAASQKYRSIGIGLLISVALVVLIGFGSCLAFYA